MAGDMSNQSGPEPSSTIHPGAHVAHYTVLHHLDSGGMGDVYLAEDPGLNRKIALKFIPADRCNDADSRRRFHREANAAAALNHPNIVTVHQIGEYNGQPFIAMEYVEGKPLKSLIREGGMRLEQVLDIAIQICEGLAEAHAADLVHCDIKPSNILIDKKGRVRILDFGLACLTDAREATMTRTHQSQLTGTIQYMSPEQVTGEPLTAASDIFSLGIVLYEMLTGRRPFRGSYEAAIMYAIANESPAPLSSARADLPDSLQTILSRMLQKNPVKRYQSIVEVANELRTLMTTQTPRQSLRQRRVRYTLIALVVIVLIIFGPVIIPGIIERIWPPDQTPRTPSLAVLPFENLGSADDEYFADGMTDAVTNRLAQIPELTVISRRSAMQYKKSTKPIRTIGNELSVSYILTGSAIMDRSETGDRVHISAQLVDAKSDTHIMVKSYDRPLTSIFAIQSEIAEYVAASLQIAVGSGWQLADSGMATPYFEAYNLYVRGNTYFNESFDRGDIESAIMLYQQAIAADSQYAPAWAMLARGHASMYWEYYDRSEQRRQLARQAAARAIKLQPNLPEARLAEAYYHYHCELDYAAALDELTRALKVQPNNADLLNAVAAIERRMGNLEGSVDNFKHALQLDPLSHQKAFDVALTYGMMRDQQDAIEYIKRTVSIKPDWSLPHIYHAWLYILQDGDTTTARQTIENVPARVDLASSTYFWWLERILEPDPRRVLLKTKLGDDTVAYQLHKAQMYRLMDRHNREVLYADSALQRLRLMIAERPDDAKLHSRLGLAFAGLRERDSAVFHARRAVELLPTHREAFDAPFLVMNLAEVYTIFSEYDAAAASLKSLLEMQALFSAPYLRLDPLWRPLKANEGFRQLLKEAA